MNKERLLRQLEQFNYYTVNKLVNLRNEKKRGIIQTSVYHKVELHWNDTYFKFWNIQCDDVCLHIDSNIDIENTVWNGNVLRLHIVDCPEIVDIVCYKK